jgi:VanZ family protein
MTEGMPRAAPRTTAAPLAAAWAVLIVYASWFPFDGWTWPSAPTILEALALAWPPWRDRFDEIANLAGYVPFGFLATVLVLRRGVGARAAVIVAIVGAALLAYTVEVVQGFLPARVPSLKDLAFNLVGSAIGAATAAVLHGGGALDVWQRTRERWFASHSPMALTLLLLWPVGLLFPLPVPLGLGFAWTGAGALVEQVFAATPWSARVQAWLDAMGMHGNASMDVSAPQQELLVVALGLLGPCLLAYAATRHARRRLRLALGACALAVAVTTLSTALSFGPDHALAWFTPGVMWGMVVGAAMAVPCAALPSRAAAWLGVLVVGGSIVAVSFAPTDPYYAQSLSTWEQGQFIRFHGLAQWVGWLWPYVALAWLIARGLRAAPVWASGDDTTSRIHP